MKKKDILRQIDLFAAWAASYINDSLRHAAKYPCSGIAEEERTAASAFSLCAGRLANQLGLASLTWDKPESDRRAA